MHFNRIIVVGLAAFLTTLAGGSAAVAAEPISVTIDAGQKRPEINPFIYGQFIEHLGRCIYGGIWAEMLEDRKFYFPISEKYDPYKELRETAFPVVGASPWQIIGESAHVRMLRKMSFVGEHTPQISPGGAIRQRDLGVIAGKKYTGYIWLKASEGQGGPVEVRLVWGERDADRQTHKVSSVTAEYQKYEFSFTAGATTDSAMLEVHVGGEQAVMVGALSLMPADNVRGMRADTLALLKQLNATMYRWPGGNFVSGYNWRDGIGPRDRRPPRRNPAWTGVEHNDFGIDEFLDFCRELRAEPLIAANTGFGDAYSAAQEVEYCNASADTVGGSWRAGNGHPQPYRVRYWCVGNEMFGPWQLGFMQLRHYAEKHNRVARAMRDVDGSIQLIGIGNLGGRNPRHDPDEKRGWSRGMLEQCADQMDYISEHFYIGQTKQDTAEHVAQMVNAIRQKAEGHRKLQGELANLQGRLVPIAMDEWNYWYRDYQYGELGCVYHLRDALGVAAGLHEYFRHSDVIQMAHYAQTVNVIGCIKTTRTKAFLSATALPLMLYREQFGATPVSVAGNHDTAALDVAAALTADGGGLTIGVVNPKHEQAVMRVVLAGGKPNGSARVWRIAGDDPQAFNSAQQQPIVIDGPRRVSFDGALTLPACSVSLYHLVLERK